MAAALQAWALALSEMFFVKPGMEDKMTTGIKNQKFPLSSQVALLLH